MTIDRLNGVNPLENLNNTSKVAAKTVASVKADSISISDEAREMSEIYYMAEVAKETPDVREDLIASIREKIKDPGYLASSVEATADNILTTLGL